MGVLNKTCPSLFATLVFFASPLWAQFTSAIEGTVKDPSGRVVPGATVVVTNVETRTTREAVTSDAGYFRITSLPPSTFEVSVSLPGFKTSLIKGIRLEVSQTKSLDVALELGAPATVVEVTGAPPAVETSEARVSGHIEQEKVRSLPLVGRNFYSLVVLTPGVTGLPSGGGQAYAQATADVFNAEFGVNLNANGQRAESNSFLIDSASVNASPRGGVTNLTPNADSVQELRVAVNNFSAEYARNASAVINVVTKQGTNDLHGSFGWFYTNDTLTSRTYPQNQVPEFKRNEINWSVGGPIWKNRTFFFASMDVLRSNVGVSSNTSVVTQDFINFMKTNHPDRIATKIVSSFPAKVTPTTAALFAGPLAGVVPNVAACGSLPGGASGPVETPIGSMPCNMALTTNGIFSDTVLRNGLQWNARIDHNFNNGKDRIYGNFYRTNRDTVAFAAPSVYPDFTVIQPEYTMYFNLNHTHVFGPKLLNEMSVSANRARGDVPLNHGDIPAVTVPGIAGYGQGFADATFIQNNLEWRNVLTYNRGEHSFKGGFRYAIDSGFRGAGAFFEWVNARPTYSFLNLFDFARDDPFSEGQLAYNFKTGKPGGLPFRPTFPGFGWFIQDDWKVRPNLTLGLGLRWETFLKPDDHDGIFANITFAGGNSFAERIANARMEVKKSLDETDKNNFAPRLGIAWDPTGKGKMSIRAGAGIFYDRPFGQFFHDSSTFLPVIAPIGVSKNTTAQPVYALGKSAQRPYDFPFPDISLALDSKGGVPGLNSPVRPNDPLMRSQYSINWFLGIQRELAAAWSVEVDYIGAGGRKLYQVYDVNRFNGDLFDGRLDRLNSSFGSIGYGQANGISAFHGGTFMVRRRDFRGLDFHVAYTLGKAIDTASSGTDGPVVDITNQGLARGLADFDIRQKFASGYLLRLPGFRGGAGAIGRVLSGWQLSGVTILQSGRPFTVTCGLPFIPVLDAGGNLIGNSGCDFNADGNTFAPLSAPAFGNSKHGDRRDFQFPNQIFTVDDFPKPSLGQNGTLGRNTFIGPGYANTDFALLKVTRIPWKGSDQANIQFRVEFFNVFNRVNLQPPASDITSSLFGSSTAALPARNIQFGLRFEF